MNTSDEPDTIRQGFSPDDVVAYRVEECGMDVGAADSLTNEA